MNEKEIKELFDNLDCEDTDRLLKNIDVKGFDDEGVKPLNHSRIEQMVFEKAGLSKQSEQSGESEEVVERKVEIIRWKKYSAFAAVACFGFLLGIATMVGSSFLINRNKDNMPAEESYVADNADNDENDEQLHGQNGNYDEDSDELWSDEVGESQKDKDDKTDKTDKDDKNGKDDKKDNNDKKPPHNDIKTGDEGDDKYLRMPSDDVDKIIANATSEIDMDSFLVKYGSVDAMVEDSDCIVRGFKEESTWVETDEKDVYRLVAKFQVDSILVDNLGDIKDVINVNEGIKYYSKEDKIIHSGGYENMTCGKEYILFLKKTSTKRYRIAGIIYGKVPLDMNEEMLELDSSYQENKYVIGIKNIISEAREIYAGMDSGDDEENNTSEKEAPTATPSPSATSSPEQPEFINELTTETPIE